MLKRNEKLLRVDIRPEIPQRKKLSDQYLKVIELSQVYDKVFWVVDLDVILSSSLKVKKGNKKTIRDFTAYKKVIDNKYKNVMVLINQPCLEFWFLTHFEVSAQQFADCDEARKRLKKYLPDYEKTQKYFTRQNKDIYLRLKPHLERAVNNSKKLPTFEMDNLYKGVSEMYKFIEVLDIV